MNRDRQTQDASQLKPQYFVQKCPVCNGWGTVSFKRITCHACEGKGYIIVPAEKDRKKDYGKPKT